MKRCAVHGRPGTSVCHGRMMRWAGMDKSGPAIIRLCERHLKEVFHHRTPSWIKVDRRTTKAEAFRLVMVQVVLES